MDGGPAENWRMRLTKTLVILSLSARIQPVFLCRLSICTLNFRAMGGRLFAPRWRKVSGDPAGSCPWESDPSPSDVIDAVSVWRCRCSSPVEFIEISGSNVRAAPAEQGSGLVRPEPEPNVEPHDSETNNPPSRVCQNDILDGGGNSVPPRSGKRVSRPRFGLEMLASLGPEL